MKTKNNNSVLLDVEHVWQLDPEHEIPQSQRVKVCALACMKMLIDYVVPQEKSLTIGEIYQKLNELGGRDTSGDWKHSSEVNFLKTCGLTAWRRNWSIALVNEDPKWFVDNEQYNPAQLSAVSEQMIEENKAGKRDARMLYSLYQSLKAGFPVIMSVKPGFSNNGKNHQIVVSGFEDSVDGKFLWILDPLLAFGDPKSYRKISVDEYLQYSRRLAIFVSKS